MVEYEKRDLLGSKLIAVLVKGLTVGNIREHGQDGSYLYYKGSDNRLNWTLQDNDLGALKKEIESTLK
jgi:hypothetical protein